MLEPDRSRRVTESDARVKLVAARAVELKRPKLIRSTEHEVKEDDVDTSVRQEAVSNRPSNQELEVATRNNWAGPRSEMPARPSTQRTRELLDD